MTKVFLVVSVFIGVILGCCANGIVNLTRRCEVVFFDVGQGDASLVNCGNKRILIDAGPDDFVVYKLGHYLYPWEKSIDILILTHEHADHINGLYDLINRYEIKEIWYNWWSEKSAWLLARLKRDGLNVKSVCENMTDTTAENTALQATEFVVKVLSPPCTKSEKFTSMEGKNVNNSSIVLLVEISKMKFLFMGDAETELESTIVSQENVTYLKAGHHCSDTSSGYQFVRAISPQFAICSVGKENKYGHPSESTLRSFEELGVKYFVTYESGDVVVKL